MQYESIWQKVLRSQESVRYEFSIGSAYQKYKLVTGGLLALIIAGFLFSAGIIWVGVLIVLLVFFYYGYYLKVANAYAFTDKRIIIHKGWLSTRTTSVDYDKITDVTVREGFIDKAISKSGTLIVNTAGTAGLEVVLSNIEHPYEVKKKLDELRG